MFELYEGTKLLVKTAIKDWKTSTRGNTAMMFNCSGYKPTVYDAVYLDTAKVYNVLVTNMVKK
jgi:predicted nucleic acid-binding protein